MNKTGFGTLNWVVLIIYLLAMLGVGAYFTKKASKNTDSFFKAEGSVPAWAAGFSIYATTLSAITFMSTPEQAFLQDWSYAFGNLSILLMVPFLIKYYVPFFRKLKVTSAYEYLEERFHPVMRILGSVLFMLYHIGRVAIVIYLPIIAITSVSDINPIIIALIVGGLCIVYTFLGGIEGVIWSDVIQGFLLLGGALLVCILGAHYISGGWGTIAHDAVTNHKLISGYDFQFSDLSRFVPLIFAGQIFNGLYQYTGSQDVVQRYQTTSSMKEAAKSLWTNGFLALITIPIFYGMGTVLFSYYKHTVALPKNFNTSAIVPYFIVNVLPAGIAGLIIAAIFAAAQSTVASSLNAISSCAVTDFKQRFFDTKFKNISDVTLARLIIIGSGLLGLALAIYLMLGNTSQTWNLFLAITGIFGVPIAGIFAVGIFTEKANTPGVLTGLIASAIITYFVQAAAVSPFIVSCVSFIAAFVISYIISLLTPNYRKNIVGLTVSTKDQDYVK
ncbi:sodium:solute symporter [Loigolactobacillus coryniformis]|uniref:sodium:solute symporter n=1 Tax=Loigolactobacillus coryniformis TaxID=1610 RepID=UPI002341F450|nr:sodium:solute symporter [Loigolactobacillus coryniformis]MDC4186810.1 sodium:solute symporter [Loigolactobacillus coryniformis]